ncbi:FAD-dependent oxidoreductase [Anoxybacter fermentans]|uniref:FAD-dependent oxidoreductase n=1 Tax=Anoxybacter fermentans TaxID=1323375 RepID=A0A3Q9HPK9_9FIRM|nr:FAD-dependent oxidoreductase [Anoxybacter fermentans]AZR72706.1 FAD-dependent oxidoreductase [Anoxybacter fermentans]
MPKVVVVGGGWAGTAAAVAAKKAGAREVILFERTDMLLGTGLVGGIMRNNGRWTATEEAIAMGGGDLFKIADRVSRHKNIDFPGHKHASLYDVALIEPAIKRYLIDMGIDVRINNRVTDIKMKDQRVIAVKTSEHNYEEADVFVDCTGSAGPMNNCIEYGNGCVMCIYRCPTFGPRVSIVEKAGIKEIIGKKGDGTIGAMSGSCKLHKESIAEDIVKELNEKGVVVVPIPRDLIDEGKLGIKACQQYALKEYAENIILLDTGHAKLMVPFMPLDKLRKVPGFENARYEDPYAGGIGNSMRYMGMAPRDNYLKVKGLDNVFCAGEKAGLLVGHTEACITGTLAGHNAVRLALGKELLEIPDTLAIGDAIAYVNTQMQDEVGRTRKYTFSGSVYFERMKEKNLYTTDLDEIKKRVEDAGLTNVFANPVTAAVVD